jgi:CRISPR-associated protein Cmr6
MNPKQRRQNQPSTARGVEERTEEIRYPVPSASAAAWRKYQRARVHNPGLVFERFVRDWGWYEQRGDKEAKQKAWKEIEPIVSRGDAELLEKFNTRWEHDAAHVNANSFALETDWRFITGLGRKGPLEAGFTFNRYGFPILPGSSVKGIARAYAFYQLAELLQSKDLGALDKLVSEDDEKKYREGFAQQFHSATQEAVTLAKQFRAVFGTTNNAGCAIFLDAIPTQVPTLQLDIMNPHFPDYYTDKSNRVAPTDWQSPNPVFFLTVAPNTEFRFAVGWRGKADEPLQRLAQKWLKKGLQKLGAGAKTSAGYGYFKPDGTAGNEAKVEEVVQTAAPVAPAQPMRPSTRHTAVGKIRYESGKPYVQIEGQRRRRINWKELGIRELKDKTQVEIEYEEFEDGTYKVVRVTEKGG